jgi:UDP-glucose 4-epimerase
MHHSKQGVLNWFIRQLLDGQRIVLYGDGSQIRDINFVEEVVDALLQVAKSKKTSGEIFNLGGHPMSLVDFVKKAIEVLGHGSYKTLPFPKDRKSIEVGNYVADISKIREQTGWNPSVSIEEGLAKTFDYYRSYKKYYW